LFFEWGDILLLVKNWRSLLVFLQGLLENDEGIVEAHQLLKQQLECQTH
jgi:hypothetical protein